MFKLIKFVIIIGLIAGAYAYVSPARTIQQLTQALENEDAKAVSQYVDFDRVRESLQSDFAQKMNLNPDSGLGNVLATQITGAFLSGIISPETMVTVLKDKSRRDRLGLSDNLGEVLSRGSWLGGDYYVVRNDNGDPTIMLERQGRIWQVVAIRLK